MPAPSPPTETSFHPTPPHLTPLPCQVPSTTTIVWATAPAKRVTSLAGLRANPSDWIYLYNRVPVDLGFLKPAGPTLALDMFQLSQGGWLGRWQGRWPRIRGRKPQAHSLKRAAANTGLLSGGCAARQGRAAGLGAVWGWHW